MTTNLTAGPIQVINNDVVSVNIALAQILERLDDLKGLRGNTTIHDRVGVSVPTATADAVNLGSLQDTESLFHISFVAGGPAGLLSYQPGTTYAEISDLLRQRVNFSTPVGLEARVIAGAWGTESGTDKGLAMTQDDGTVIAEVEWDGQAEGVQVGSYTSVSLTTDTTVQLRAKGATATESLIIRHVGVDFRFDIDVATAEGEILWLLHW